MTTIDGARLAILTGKRAPTLTEDGRALADALAERRVRTDPVVWTEGPAGTEGPNGWSRYDAVLVRSCWDYHANPDGFHRALDDIDRRERQVDFPEAPWN
ncbi:hypothetical protein [Halosolutus gelatinilyticus]|uniref:hypothetical protein n=1 Tax=Halosolutus gelatinilyticus TaxID=2931975 RepID=UPI001FF23097|nr:hypothetical protein [Halosolutus gelatinilyticus]